MQQNQKIASELAKQIAAMGYTLDGKNMPHGHAMEVVSKVAGLPNWDTLSAALKKNSKRVEMVAVEDIVHLYMEGHDMGCVNEYSVCSDVIAIIDMNRVRNAARVLHANKGLLESVRIDADYRIGDNVDSDEFTPYGAWVDIYSTKKDGSPNFGMFCIQQKYSDDVHSKGLYFSQPHCGDWSPAWIEDEVVYIAHRGDARIEKCQIDSSSGRFATNPENEDAVEKVGELSPELIKKMRLAEGYAEWYDLSVSGVRKSSAANDAFEAYNFGDNVEVVSFGGWDVSDKSDFIRIVYVRYGDDVLDADSHKISFHVRFTSDGTFSEAYALEMEHGQEIGNPVSGK